MIYFKNYFLTGLLLISFSEVAQKITTLKPTRFINVAIPEPSDICYNSKTNTFYIVSDTGILFETDSNAKIIRKIVQKDTDFEAVYSDDNKVYAVDETNRNIYIYDSTTFKEDKVINLPYNGGKNKGYEAFTYNTDNQKFILLTEKDPIILFELDLDFKITKQTILNSIAKDISSAKYYHDFLWLLSDESMMLMKLNPNTYEVIQKWTLPVINPEGFAFDSNGNLIVTCDDMQRMYYFNNPEKK
ncbi:SdiA-regulated domain-containing protein [Flavobacterium luteum]|uniref:Uncharacterized protein n=1 Tax=Flavobacterium luteum TaxID=2026654 RepID=A0A7J5ABN4_9FLAO|nr:SdiA-regulated domain-containing protein [Flavobacterium luteum]KAB1154940.1 hypothetical protein F6464_10975 [Flavobacterium luteum]